MADKFTGTATYESPKDKADAKEYADMRKAKTAYFEERAKRLKLQIKNNFDAVRKGGFFYGNLRQEWSEDT